MSGHVHFVLGGARSGKSRHAEALVGALSARPWVYVATAEALDSEMEERIARHRHDRGAGWTTVEAPHDLAGALVAHGGGPSAVLVDCLTLWLSNRLLAGADLERETAALLATLDQVAAPLVLVSNEVGLGIVPDNALSRRFRDAAGRLHQAIAARADRVTLVVAGLPLQVR